MIARHLFSRPRLACLPRLPFLLTALLTAAAGCRPASTEPPVLVKLEWGALDPGRVPWHGRVSLEGATLLDAVPYVFEPEEVLELASLTFNTYTEGTLTDGLLLRMQAGAGARVRVQTEHGGVDLELASLPLDQARLTPLAGGTYLEAARITQEEWETALSYNSRPTQRGDAMPEPAYRAGLEVGRVKMQEAQAGIEAEARWRFEDDPHFRNAETLRRGVNQQLYVFAPSVLEVGERFDLTVTAFDLYGRPAGDFRGSVEVRIERERAIGPSGAWGLELPSQLYLDSAAPGSVTMPGAGVALEPGYYRIEASDPSGRFRPGAMPVRVGPAGEADGAARVFWGDIHTHTHLSDGDFADVGPDETYAYGRDVAHLDFQALTDHDYRRPIPDWKWPLEVDAAARFYEPGRFVTLLAYEWSGEDIRFSDVISHKNVYFRDGVGPIYSAFDPRYNTPEKLWAALRAAPGVGRAFTIPHHSVRKVALSEEEPWYGGAGTDWRFHDEAMQPLVEVYSRWGSSELTGPENPRPVRDAREGGSVREALGLGYRLGLMASGDVHDGTPGVSALPMRQTINPYPTGLVAVWAPELTREAVFDALIERRCYGTSGGRRMLLDLRAWGGGGSGEGVTVGGEYVVAAGEVGLELTVAGTTGLEEVAIIRVDDLETVTVWRGRSEGWLLRAEVVDPDFERDAAYYLRVTQVDNELGWLGPLFVTRG